MVVNLTFNYDIDYNIIVNLSIPILGTFWRLFYIGYCRLGARFMKQTYNNCYPKFLVKQSYNVFYKKNTLKKYDLQESYKNFKI